MRLDSAREYIHPDSGEVCYRAYTFDGEALFVAADQQALPGLRCGEPPMVALGKLWIIREMEIEERVRGERQGRDTE